MPVNDCIFCQIISGKIPGDFVYKDNDFIVIRDIHPRAPVHMLIIPKEHVADFMDADSLLLEKLLSLVKKIIAKHNVTNYRLVNNGGGAAYIDHMHVHLMGAVAKDRDL